jgi:predicted DNA-binding protein (MmcQ/YjbR family)
MPRKPHHALAPEEQSALLKLRALCNKLERCEETVTFGHPTFKTRGKTFAVIDRYQEASCLWLRVHPTRRRELLAAEGWFKSPYDKRETALCCKLDAIDWRRIGPLLRESHALAAARTTRPPAG